MNPTPRAEPNERERRELLRFAQRLAQIHANDPDTALSFWIRATKGDLDRVAGDDDQKRDRIFYAALLRGLRQLRRQRHWRAFKRGFARLLPTPRRLS